MDQILELTWLLVDKSASGTVAAAPRVSCCPMVVVGSVSAPLHKLTICSHHYSELPNMRL
jgi:hypothetical protein